VPSIGLPALGTLHWAPNGGCPAAENVQCTLRGGASGGGDAPPVRLRLDDALPQKDPGTCDVSGVHDEHIGAGLGEAVQGAPVLGVVEDERFGW